MEESVIRKYAGLMQELGLTGLEIKEKGCEMRLERGGAALPAAAPAPAAKPETPQRDDGRVEVKSPMVGVFYSSPAENAEPFVHVGDRVKKGDVLCIIEAMKLMNEICSEYDGVVDEICVTSGKVVDYGYVLFRLKKEQP